jgi:hypothetical protein
VSGEKLFTRGAMHQGAWLVYLNGLEVPCPQVSTSYGVWAIPEATISFPPHRLLERLGREDRIEVVVFFLDDLTDPNNPEFKLFYEGEIIGWSYRNTGQGRTMSFNVIADIAIFTQLYYFFLNTVDAVVGMQTPGKNAEGFSQPGAFYPFSLFKKGLLIPKPVKGKSSAEDIKRPFELIFNILRAICESKLPLESRAIPAVNFFSRWVRKRNFINRFVALPVFEDTSEADTKAGVFPIFQAAQATAALQTMQTNLAMTIGEQGNMFQMLQTVLGHVYFELAMLPTAPCFRVSLETGNILGPSTTPPSNKDKKETEPLRLMNYFAKPQLLFSVPPMCNVIFPSMSPSFTYSENYVAQPTRIYMNDQFISGLIQADPLMASALTVGYPPEVNALVDRKRGKNGTQVAHINETGKNCLVFPEEFFRGPVVSRRPVPEWFTYLQNKNKNKPSSQRWAKVVGDTNDQAATLNANENSTLLQLYSLYTEYEYYRCRYEKRGGAVDLAFNPFVVPGFPCVVFDNRTSAFDLVGYMMNVTQSLSSEGGSSSGSMTTSFNFGFGRTLQEMLELLSKDLASLQTVLIMAPAEPIESIRDICQKPDQAETFYQALFHGRKITHGRMASFDFRRAVGYVKDDGIELIHITDTAAASAQVQSAETLLTGPVSSTDQKINPETTVLRTTLGPLVEEWNHLQKLLLSVHVGVTSAQTLDNKTQLLQVEADTRDNIKKYAEDVMIANGIAMLHAGVKAFFFSPKTAKRIQNIVYAGSKTVSAEGGVPNADTIPYIVEPDHVGKVLQGLTDLATAIIYDSYTMPGTPGTDTGTQSVQTITHNLDATREIQPQRSYEEFFQNYDAAMAYVARPICTLDEYLKFRHRERSLDVLMSSGPNRVQQVRSPIHKMGYANLKIEGKTTATYYERIYKLRQGEKLNEPMALPDPSQTGTVPATTPSGKPAVYTGKPTGVDSTFVQTRNDWDSILEEYRAEMYNLAPQR